MERVSPEDPLGVSCEDLPEEPAEDPVATEANRVAEGILAKAREHQRRSNHYREKSRDLMTRFERFQARCAELGIAVKGEGDCS